MTASADRNDLTPANEVAPIAGTPLPLGEGGLRELNLADIVATLWRRRLVVAACMLSCLALGVVYLRTASYEYTAELRVTSVQSDKKGMSEQLGGLASVAGIELPQSKAVSPIILYVEDLHSYDVAEILSRQPELMTVAFSNAWDKSRHRWVRPVSTLGVIKDGIFRLLGLPTYPWQPPSAADMREYLKRKIDVGESKTKPIVSIQFRHADPRFAVKFLNVLHQAADQRQRERALDRSTQAIAYLNHQLSYVTNAEHRRALFEELSDQERLKMTASSNMPFAAEPLGATISSQRPTSPKPMLTLILSAVIGIVLGVGIAVAMELTRVVPR